MAEKMKRNMEMRDESMGGFPSGARMENYAKPERFSQIMGPNEWDVSGVDAEINRNVSDLNKNKSRQRF